MIKQMTVFFSGQVQGVGFRFTVDRIARRFEVTGYVRNLRDGRVEVRAQGEEPALKDFLIAIRESEMQPYIRDLEIVWSAPEGTYAHFSITTI